MKFPIYMDHHATTPVDPRVLEAMLPYFSESFGNAASRNHKFGWEAEAAVETARGQVAYLINARPEEIIFTSGATESDNLAVKGVAWARRSKGTEIITLATEHKAILDSCRRLEGDGFGVTYMPLEPDGLVDFARLEAAVSPGTILVTVMAANNEIGVLQPIAEIGKLCRARGIIFHTDGVQAVGKIPIDVEAMSVDLMSITAHKLYGPKGIGALYIRSRPAGLELVPIADGGGQERGIRPGTLNVPGIVGLGKACEICRQEMSEESSRLRGLRDRLKQALLSRLDDVHINGSMERRLPHNLNVSFRGVDAESLMLGINDVAVSSGSACLSGTREPSYVLRALGIDEELAQNPIRFGLGRFNTREEVDYVSERVVETVKSLREVSLEFSRVRDPK
jgi:cysteine desulfurase